MNKKRKILWGGATASSQYEGGYNLGGKGLDTQDCRPYLKRTSNATTSTRLLTQDIIDEAKSCKEVGNYPFRQGSDGYHHIDEDIQIFIAFLSAGQDCIHMVMKKCQMKKEYVFMTIFLKRFIKQE